MLTSAQIKYLNLIRTHLTDMKGKAILEIGCGNGLLAKYMLESHPALVVGIDYALDTTWHRSEETSSDYRLYKMDATKLDFDSDTFDYVYSINTFEHIDDLRTAFSELARVIKPGGMAFTIFSPIWSSRLGYHYNHWDEKISKHIPPWGHLYLNEEQMYQEILRSSGSEELAKSAISNIYHRSGPNRLHYSDYMNLFKCCMDYGLIFNLKGMQDLDFLKYPMITSNCGLNIGTRPDICGFIGTISKSKPRQ